MGALLSLPLLAVPSMGSVGCLRMHHRQTLTSGRLYGLWVVVAVLLLVLQYVALAENAVTGMLNGMYWENSTNSW